MKIRMALTAFALSIAIPIPASAQLIAPHASALFLPIPAAGAAPVDSSGTDNGDIVTPVILGGLAGVLGSALFAMDSDGPSNRQMLRGAAVGAAVGLVVGAALHSRKD